MSSQCQSMLDPWEVLQRFKVGIPGSSNQHPLLWYKCLAQPTDLPTYSQLHPTLPIHSAAGDSVSKLQSQGAEKSRSHLCTAGVNMAELEAGGLPRWCWR